MQTKTLLQHRAHFLSQIRSFFQNKDFIEVETPLLIPSPDPSPFLDSFETSFLHSQPLFLHTSPEIAMKRYIASGAERIFQITKFFRKDELSPLHNPEFTGLEWYAVQKDYTYLMEMMEELICFLFSKKTFFYQNTEISLEKPWKRITVHQAFQKFANIELPDFITEKDLLFFSKQHNLQIDPLDSWDDLFFRLFLNLVEPKLLQETPIFLYDYPIQLGALARKKTDNPHIAERVELYISHLEIANGYSELIDGAEQKKRWEKEKEQRKQLNLPSHFDLDQEFFACLENMPPTSGIAVGIDRLLMLFLDQPTIQNVIPFHFGNYCLRKNTQND